MPVDFKDCSKDDVVFFRKVKEPPGAEPSKGGHRIGVILGMTKKRKLLRVSCRVKIDGIARMCEWYITTDEVIGFAI